MARLPNMLSRDQLPEHLHEAYDRVAELRQGTVSGPYGILLHSPELAGRAATMSNYLRWNAAITPAQVELAVLTLARHLDAELMWGSHSRLARTAGIPESTIEVIGKRGPLDSLSPEERDIVGYARELLEKNRVSQSAFDALHARMGNQGIVDITALVGYYSFVATILNAFEVEPPEGYEPLPKA